jgi:hypothetical protein
MLLQPYVGQMTFVHKAGKLHSNVDALSRLPREEDRDGRKEEGRRDRSGDVRGGDVTKEESRGKTGEQVKDEGLRRQSERGRLA